MKHLLLSLLTFSLFLSLSAQDEIAFSTGYCDQIIKSITIRDDNQYAIAFNQSDAQWTNGMNPNLAKKVMDINRLKRNIKQIETQSDGGYILIWDKNQAEWTNDMPKDLVNKIVELNKSKAVIKNIALRDDDAFVMIWNKNDAIWTNNLPSHLIEKIKELNRIDAEIKQVVLRQDGGYAVLYNKNDVFWTNNLPPALIAKIKKLNQEGREINWIELTDNGQYVIVWDNHYASYSSGIHPELKKQLRKLSCNKSQNTNIQKSTISWNLPSKSYEVVEKNIQTVQACIQSSANIEEVKLYVNGKVYETSRDFVIKKSTSKCTVNFEKSIYLNEGKNEIKIEAYNQGGQTMSSLRTINVKKK